MSEQIKLNVIHRTDGLCDIFIYHPEDKWWKSNRIIRERNKHFVNFLRKKYPRVLNEFRTVPFVYNKDGWPNTYQNGFVAYGLTKQQYLMIKLSLTFTENVFHNKTRAGKPVKWQTYHRELVPSDECEKRWEDPNYKPSQLKIK